MRNAKSTIIRDSVKQFYGDIANSEIEDCGCSHTSCCGNSDVEASDVSVALGYTKEELASLPEGANLGFGCGNPQAIASLKAGETVLDLGSGAGIDCFLAAKAVGETGSVIGVDMTSEMLNKARVNAEKVGFKNIDFRLGEIEELPVEDNTVDVIISNCVINLSPEKEKVFAEAYRVLKPGGRLAISDIVTTAEIPDDIRNDMELYSACISGASSIDNLKNILGEIGFKDVQINPKSESKEFISQWAPGMNIEDFVVSANILAVK